MNKLSESKAQEFKDKQLKALDCGAGIGRITKNCLLKFFDKVDLLDNCANFLKEARAYIGEDVYDKRVSSICSSLHTFKPNEGVLYGMRTHLNMHL